MAGYQEPWMGPLLTIVGLELAEKPADRWAPWIRRLTTVELKRLLLRVMLQDWTEEQQAALLDILGTTAAEMTPREIKTWAPLILEARNRKLAARMPLPPFGRE